VLADPDVSAAVVRTLEVRTQLSAARAALMGGGGASSRPEMSGVGRRVRREITGGFYPVTALTPTTTHMRKCNSGTGAGAGTWTATALAEQALLSSSLSTRSSGPGSDLRDAETRRDAALGIRPVFESDITLGFGRSVVPARGGGGVAAATTKAATTTRAATTTVLGGSLAVGASPDETPDATRLRVALLSDLHTRLTAKTMLVTLRALVARRRTALASVADRVPRRVMSTALATWRAALRDRLRGAAADAYRAGTLLSRCFAGWRHAAARAAYLAAASASASVPAPASVTASTLVTASRGGLLASMLGQRDLAQFETLRARNPGAAWRQLRVGYDGLILGRWGAGRAVLAETVSPLGRGVRPSAHAIADDEPSTGTGGLPARGAPSAFVTALPARARVAARLTTQQAQPGLGGALGDPMRAYGGLSKVLDTVASHLARVDARLERAARSASPTASSPDTLPAQVEVPTRGDLEPSQFASDSGAARIVSTVDAALHNVVKIARADRAHIDARPPRLADAVSALRPFSIWRSAHMSLRAERLAGFRQAAVCAARALRGWAGLSSRFEARAVGFIFFPFYFRIHKHIVCRVIFLKL
jgi:hypothetical protein